MFSHLPTFGSAVALTASRVLLAREAREAAVAEVPTALGHPLGHVGARWANVDGMAGAAFPVADFAQEWQARRARSAQKVRVGGKAGGSRLMGR